MCQLFLTILSTKMKTHVLIISRTFPKTHVKAGEPTHFIEKMSIIHHLEDPTLTSDKIHTIRVNYDLWNKRIIEVRKGLAILSLRYWSGKPYNSKQIEFTRLNANSGIGIQKLENKVDYALIDGKAFPWNYVAKNDGLSLEDFEEWFKAKNKLVPMAIIQFTLFRY